MSRKLATLNEGDTVEDAITMMQQNRYRHALVVEKGSQKLVNLISDRDILRALGPVEGAPARGNEGEAAFHAKLFATDKGDPVLREKVTSLTSRRDVITVLPTTPLVEAITTLIDKDINSLPVVDANGILRGLITSLDVLRVTLAALRLSRKTPPEEPSVG